MMSLTVIEIVVSADPPEFVAVIVDVLKDDIINKPVESILAAVLIVPALYNLNSNLKN